MNAKIFTHEDIIHYVFLEDSYVTYEGAVENNFKIGQLTNGKRYLLLADIRAKFIFEEKAENYIASSKIRSKIKALAILLNGETMQSNLNLFAEMGKGKLITKVFVSQNHAIEWLKSNR